MNFADTYLALAWRQVLSVCIGTASGMSNGVSANGSYHLFSLGVSIRRMPIHACTSSSNVKPTGHIASRGWCLFRCLRSWRTCTSCPG